MEAWLSDEPTPIEPGAPLREYLRTVILGAHLERLPAADRAAFVEAVADPPADVVDRLRPAQHPRDACATPAESAAG